MAGSVMDGWTPTETEDRPVTARARARETNIASAIDALDYAIEQVVKQVETTRERIQPVLHRRPLDEDDNEGSKDSPENRDSDLNQTIVERAERLARLSLQIAEMNRRIDL